MLCAATLPMLAAGAEMPSYCAGTSPYNSEGNHYGANNYKMMVNGEEELSILLLIHQRHHRPDLQQNRGSESR